MLLVRGRFSSRNSSLGNIIRDGSAVIREAPWLTFFPGGVIMIIVLLLNLLGDNLREILDPKRKYR